MERITNLLQYDSFRWITQSFDEETIKLPQKLYDKQFRDILVLYHLPFGRRNQCQIISAVIRNLINIEVLSLEKLSTENFEYECSCILTSKTQATVRIKTCRDVYASANTKFKQRANTQ